MINKLENLKNYLKDLKSVAIAYSSGVDSTFLLKVASDTLKNNVLAITAKSILIPNREILEAQDFCKKENINHIIFDFHPLDIENFSNNSTQRCYFCKKELFKKIIEIAQNNNISNILEGSNLDDLNDFRPGLKAIKELNIKSPLQLFHFTKDEIRKLSKDLNLNTYNKASFACLASRIPYNQKITQKDLSSINQAEDFLHSLGFTQFRVRSISNNARIEILPQQFPKLLNLRLPILNRLTSLGFKNISLDLQGYKQGNLNDLK